MKATWILLLTVSVVAADVGLGYQYKVPQPAFDVPTVQIGGNSGQYSSAYASNVGNVGNVDSSSSNTYDNTAFPAGTVQSTTGLGSGYYQSAGGSSSVDSIPTYLYNSGLNSGYQTQYSSSSQYQIPNADKYQQHYEIHQQPAQVFKHFYVHSAPEEPEIPKPRTPIVLPPPQKHYKIIFVKTPTETTPPPPVIPVQPQNEEKTIVYVLVKKPEEQKEVVVPKVEQKPPSKPEVFFIKYKNKEDSEAVIENIVKDYNGQQVSILNPGLGADNSFNTVSGLSDVAYNSAAGINGVSFNTASDVNGLTYNAASGVSDVSYNSATGVSGASYSTVAPLNEVSYDAGASLSDATYNAASGFGNVQYDAPAQNAVSSSAQSYGLSGSEESAYSLASANSGVDVNEANISSTIASPITVSTTASSVDYDGASAIASSQGVPHETYGPPSFREN